MASTQQFVECFRLTYPRKDCATVMTGVEIEEETFTKGSGTPADLANRLEVAKELRAEDIWPFRDKVTGKVVLDPDFDDYILWMRELEGKRKLLEGLNMPRTFIPRPYQV